MTTLEDADGDDRRVECGVEHEADRVSDEAHSLQEDTRETEREVKASAGLHLHEMTPEVTGLYDVLDAAGVLISTAKACLTGAPAKSALRSKLREVVESMSKIVDEVADLIKQSLKAGQSEPPEED
jgi:hypothetical protein